MQEQNGQLNGLFDKLLLGQCSGISFLLAGVPWNVRLSFGSGVLSSHHHTDRSLPANMRSAELLGSDRVYF